MTESHADLVAAIRERRDAVLEAIASSARRAGRPPESARLVIVTKSQPVRVVAATIEAGARLLGENYAEETVLKMDALRAMPAGDAEPASRAGSSVEWHMIGHVQSRKARLVAQHFDMVHSIDSIALATRLDQLAREQGRVLPALLEFNVGEEADKYGWPASREAAWPRLLEDVGAVAALRNLQIRGVMTMPPLATDPEESRPYFRRLAGLRTFLAEHLPAADWSELSMGTSGDYRVAVEEGATLVRVGEAILGPRSPRESA